LVSELATTNGADRLLRADELAERWQVPKAQVYRLTRDGVIPAVRIGRYYRYALPAIAAFEASGGAGADA
jgi:excisionase family DNA binding protein